jgi:hypothetical protein
MLRRAILAAGLWAVASVGMAADAAGVVVVRDSAAVAGCRSLGEVRGSSLWGGLMANTAYGKALSQIKAKTKRLGGTHVQLLDSASGYSGSRMLGTAFECPPQQTGERAGRTPPN